MGLNRGVRITWLGHATFMVESPGGKRILIDPFLRNNPRCPEGQKRIDACDLILLTHAHSDHIEDAIPVAEATGARIVAIVELGAWIQSKGASNVTMMNKGGTIRIGEIAVTMVNAFHTSAIQDGDKTLYGGEPAGYVVRLENGFTFYHAGDTCIFGDMALIGELYKPELAMLPIGDHFTMGPFEAAKAIRLLGSRHVVPMHYGTFPPLVGTPDELKRLTADISGLVIHTPSPGETIV